MSGKMRSGFFQAPALAFELEQVPVVHQPIEQRRDDDDIAVEVATHDERQPTPILPLCVTGRTTPTAVANVVQLVKTGSEPSNSSIMFNMICLTCAADLPSRALAEHQFVDAPLITMPDDEVLW